MENLAPSFYEAFVVGNDLSSGLIALECQRKGLKTLWLYEEELSLGHFDNSSQMELFCEFLPETPEARYLLPWLEELLDEPLHTGSHSLNHWAMERVSKDVKPFLWKSSSVFLYDFFLKPRALTLQSFPSYWLEKTKQFFQGKKKLRAQITSLQEKPDKSFSFSLNEKKIVSKYVFWTSSLERLKQLMPHIRSPNPFSILSLLYFNWSHKVPLQENPHDLFYLLSSLKSSHPEVFAMVKFRDHQTSQWLSVVEDTEPDSVVGHLKKIKVMVQKIKPEWYKSVSKEFLCLKPHSYGRISELQTPENLYFASPINCESEGVLAYIQSAFETLKIWDQKVSP